MIAEVAFTVSLLGVVALLGMVGGGIAWLDQRLKSVHREQARRLKRVNEEQTRQHEEASQERAAFEEKVDAYIVTDLTWKVAHEQRHVNLDDKIAQIPGEVVKKLSKEAS